VFVLDACLNPQPVGVPGELFIGGDGLARGYLNQPELTREKFIPHPFSSDPGARLYRTGDRVRYLADGTLEFRERIDRQVKILGFRIELGEIETVLKQHPGVRDALVIARPTAEGGQRLVGYWVAQNNPAPTLDDLRRYLTQKLPDFMVPSGFVTMASLPLTPNGKVDRQALPEPETSRPSLATPFVAPRNPLEQAIARIWQEVLQLTSVGIDDNFFELGGNSLQLVRTHARLRECLETDLPITLLFQFSTIGALAPHLRPAMEPTPPSTAIQDRARRQKEAYAQKTTFMRHLVPVASYPSHLWKA
jgi:acyl carrier protein